MVFEVEFCTPKGKGDFETIHRELILSKGVNSCKEIANEIAGSMREKDIQIFIGDFFD